MKRNILPFFVSLTLVASTLFSNPVKAQVKSNTEYPKNSIDDDKYERPIVLWEKALENLRIRYFVSDDDFGTFTRFDMTPLQWLRIAFIREGKTDNFDETLLETAMKNIFDKKLDTIYQKFLATKKDYPSSVAEYAHEPRRIGGLIPCDSSGCTNMNFSEGTFNTWYGSYATNNSTTTAHRLTGLVAPAPLGAVTEALNDPTQLANMRATYWPAMPSDYQLSITSSGNDYWEPSVTRVSPFGGKHSVMLGDSDNVEAGWVSLTKTFLVTPSNANFSYQYSVFLQNPSHNYFQQPYFTAAVLDQFGDTIPNCGVYNVVSGPGLPDFLTDNMGRWFLGTTYYRPWTFVSVSLKKYIGTCVTVVFETGDCALGGHFGYAYVDASCSPLGVIASSPALCGQKSITLTAPPGSATYAWTGPPGSSIVGANNTQTITVDSSGTYTVILTPVTGAACNDTLSFTVGNAPGPPPKPSFSADTVCLGQATAFSNLSNPIGGGARFYWDFYNLGTYNDTVNVNPNWTYSSPGVYTVKLQETWNGCGYDTLVKVKVDSIPSPAFSATKECVKVPVTFSNTTKGGDGYLWNFGDPSSGTSDTSTAINPTHTFDTAGTYTVILVARNSHCPDTIKQIVKVFASPTPAIAGLDSICPGGKDTLKASGGLTYSWTGGSTATSIVVSPGSDQTYTLTASNGTCTKDTTFTVHLKSVPIPSIIAKPDTICVGDSATLTGRGGGQYDWVFNGSPDSVVRVGPIVSTIYTLQVTKNGCIALANKQVIVISPRSPFIGIRNDSICPYDSTYAYVTGGISYKWLPSGVTIDSIKAKSISNKVFTCVVTNACGVDTISTTLHIAPVPIINPKGATICIGSSGTISASGGVGAKYSWTPNTNLTCNTCASPTASPTVTTTYTVTVSNGKCSKDSVATVIVNPIPIPGVTPPQTICACTPVPLTATGGTSYLWSNGATTASITVSPCVDSTYKVKVFKNGCDSATSTTITVHAPSINVCCPVTIVKDSSGPANLTATGSGNFTWDPNNGSLNVDTGASVFASPIVTTTYTVYSTDKFGCKIADTVTVFVEIPCANFKVPNVFTPNDDGRNDDFVINVLNPTTYSIIIYNRWGQEVYTSTDPTVYWTGHLLSTPYLVPDDVYYYIIKATCGNNNYTKDGFVQVIGEKQ